MHITHFRPSFLIQPNSDFNKRMHYLIMLTVMILSCPKFGFSDRRLRWKPHQKMVHTTLLKRVPTGTLTRWHITLYYIIYIRVYGFGVYHLIPHRMTLLLSTTHFSPYRWTWWVPGYLDDLVSWKFSYFVSDFTWLLNVIYIIQNINCFLSLLFY